ncbi:MAG: 23S rRNA (pseudouridine(1915)-N(3))-methyltransferase RlmH [Verrucomicrobiales bacterium]|jgi:23S rRNA (pseudouridine1915-N3)-methyltransferase|nr:23S rRNA (pseudouridine(1915)-N(3))-methyltransferase RlmH [Verrucomicrobiales bacterium]
MKWQITAIGKPSLRYAKLGIEEYQKRLRRYTDLTLQTDSKDQGQAKNSQLLLARSEGAIRIAMDERGDSWTTEAFADRIRDWQMDGVRKVALLIGGADGHTPALRKESDHVIALSAFTLQHELALLVLLEQLYRVHTLLRGEPYHR